MDLCGFSLRVLQLNAGSCGIRHAQRGIQTQTHSRPRRSPSSLAFLHIRFKGELAPLHTP